MWRQNDGQITNEQKRGGVNSKYRQAAKKDFKVFKDNRPLYLNEFLSLAPFIFPNPRQPFHKVFIFLKFFLSLVDL